MIVGPSSPWVRKEVNTESVSRGFDVDLVGVSFGRWRDTLLKNLSSVVALTTEDID